MRESMRKKVLSVFFVGILMCGVLTACGKKKIDVTEALSVKYSGVNGYGVAELENAYAWEEEAFESAGIESIDSFASLEDGLIIESAVTYDISPKENLSNGDEIVVTATYDNEVVEEYNIKFTASERKFIVEGLPEIEYVDLFENVEVVYQGIAPNVTAYVNNTSGSSVVSVSYSIDKSSKLSLGDTVTVTAQYNKENLLDAGYMAESDTKEFTVANVAKYVSSFEEIDEETWNFIKKECTDLLESKFATIDDYCSFLRRAASNDNNSKLSEEYYNAYVDYMWNGKTLNYEKPVYQLNNMYLFNLKNMELISFKENSLVLLYKVSINDSVAGEKDVYVPISFNDIVLNDDGSIYVDIGSRDVDNTGFDFDTVYNSVVNANKANWNVLEQEIKN